MQTRDYHHPAYPSNKVSDSIAESHPNDLLSRIALIPKSYVIFLLKQTLRQTFGCK